MGRPRTTEISIQMIKPYYQDDYATIYHGDCGEIMPFIEVGAAVFDPPYGYNYSSNHVGKSTTAPWMNTSIAGDSDTALRDFVIAWAGDRPWACFGSWKMPRPTGTRGVLIWDKGPASGMGDLNFPWKGSYEEIYIGGNGWSGRRDEGVIKGRWVASRASMGRTHPNQKPVSLISHLIEKLPDTVILDPFLGSGPTLEAAKLLGRKSIGIEIEERYCEIAARRLAQEVLAL